jgi:aryl-alcohol dehydrogenase-like predicted oxidoreductase
MSSEQQKQTGYPEKNQIKEAVDNSWQELQRLATFYQQHRQDSRAQEILKAIKNMRREDRENVA